ncbi:hypothetical protein TWF730_004676 [Orbilia blumenaviensis]|uniref:Uncharacterized protein n=1 Tax=Orbilia blumenaviensis TaxID=1796055 RepID=A0AAV9TWC8_9PEZI
MDQNTDPVNVAIFTALGTIVGYLGTEVASYSIFERLLWPTRHYNYDVSHPASLLWIAGLMPMGGPIHKAAIEALDKFVAGSLWHGYCRGKMLDSAFYKNRGRHYFVRTIEDQRKGLEQKDGRNGLWISVLELMEWPRQIPTWKNDPAAAIDMKGIISQLPFFELKLSRAPQQRPGGQEPAANVTGDMGPMRLRYIFGVLISEVTTIIFGIATAVVWKSPFAVWYFVPILLKFIALFFRVRRQPMKLPEEMGDHGDGELTLYEVDGHYRGFFLIHGPKYLVYQFFHHYGHPLRDNLGLFGDRVKEIVSMLTVVGFVFVYPVGLIAFIFASSDIQWVWLGYQLMTMISMHCYRFFGGEGRGSTEEWLARELGDSPEISRDSEVKDGDQEMITRKPVLFRDDESGLTIEAQLQSRMVESVRDGRKYREKRVERILEDHAKSGNPRV